MMMRKLFTLFIAGLALCAMPARAQQSSLGIGERRPWARDVSLEKQKAADVLFQHGNMQWQNGLFAQAAESYRGALKHWDHPGIHYNLALALQNLDKDIELHEHLTAALRYDGEPLDAVKRQRAQQLKTTVEMRLTRLEVICDVPGSSVHMGQELLCVAPARFVRWVLPGEVTFTANKEGYPPNIRTRVLLPGKTVALHFRMYTKEELTRHETRWSTWKPWSVVGVGAALAAGGGWLHMRTRDDFSAFDRHVTDCAQGTEDRGCRESGLVSRRTRLERLDKVSIGTVATGGAVLVTGAVLVLLNRSDPYRIDPDTYERERGLVVTPMLGRDANGVLATFQF
jgi:hypothetical protein